MLVNVSLLIHIVAISCDDPGTLLALGVFDPNVADTSRPPAHANNSPLSLLPRRCRLHAHPSVMRLKTASRSPFISCIAPAFLTTFLTLILAPSMVVMSAGFQCPILASIHSAVTIAHSPMVTAEWCRGSFSLLSAPVTH